MDGLSSTLITSTVPVAAAAAVLVLGARPALGRWVGVGASVATLAGLVLSREDPGAITSVLMLALTVVALAAIWGHHPLQASRFADTFLLVLLGLSLGALASPSPLAGVLLAALLVSVAVAVWLMGEKTDAVRPSAVVTLGLGAAAWLGSLAAPAEWSPLLRLLGSATLLPLFPFHAALVGSVSSLPGTLPAFLVVALPCLGWHGLLLEPGGGLAMIKPAVMVLAILGALLALMRAAVQIQLTRVLGSIMVAVLAVVWWQLGTVGTIASAGWYVLSITVAAAGLLLGLHLLDARYGIRAADQAGGLARPMPRLALLVGLLVMATLGLPLLGVFTGFVAMLTAVSLSSLMLIGILLTWLFACLLLLKLWHRLFYGRLREDLRYDDVTGPEIIPFAVLLGLLLLMGRMPGGLPADPGSHADGPMTRARGAITTVEVPR